MAAGARRGHGRRGALPLHHAALQRHLALLRDLAEVRIGAAPPAGATLRQGETVSGTVIMLKGENGKNVIERVKTKLAGMVLPTGTKIRPFYDQSEVIDRTIETVKHNLIEGGVLVMARTISSGSGGAIGGSMRQ